MSLKEYIKPLREDPLALVIGSAVVMLAVMGTSIHHVASTAYLIFVLSSFVVIKYWTQTFVALSKSEKLLLFSMLLYLLSAFLSYYNTDDMREYYRVLERYLRYALFIPVYLLLVKRKVSYLNALYAGAVISGPFLLAIALRHYYLYPEQPARGEYHHIIFAQLAMLNVGILLSLILCRTLSRLMLVTIIIAMSAGLLTVILSQARGVWIVLPVYVLMAVFVSIRQKKISVSWLLAWLLALLVLFSLSPLSDMVKQRTEEAVKEVTGFYQHQQYISSVGTRLAMWQIAADVWQQYPLLGTGPGDFDDEIMALQKNGQYVGMTVFNSTHNIYVQALAGTGLIGLASLLLVTLIMPLRVFLDTHDRAAQLAGIITVVSFAVFGLSESWTLRLSITSVFLVYITVIATHIHITKNSDV